MDNILEFGRKAAEKVLEQEQQALVVDRPLHHAAVIDGTTDEVYIMDDSDKQYDLVKVNGNCGYCENLIENGNDAVYIMRGKVANMGCATIVDYIMVEEWFFVHVECLKNGIRSVEVE